MDAFAVKEKKLRMLSLKAVPHLHTSEDPDNTILLSERFIRF